MVADLRTAADEITRALIVERVQAYIDAGKQPLEASAAVWEEIKAEGAVETLALLYGYRLVSEIWRGWNLSHRPAAVSRTMTKPVHPSMVTAQAVEGEVIRPQPSPRVVNLALVRETLDSRFVIDGQYVRLGDMNAAQCIKVADQYRTAAVADEHKSRHMRAIAATLKEGETVEQRLSEQELMRLYRISKPPGNVLA